MTVSILSFSGRKNGNCAAIAAYLKQLYGDDAVIYSFGDFKLTPCGDCNHECFSSGKETCPNKGDMTKTLYEAVMNSDVSYYIVPNYCGYPCSNFFVFNERGLTCYWQAPEILERYNRAKKKFIVVSISGADTIRTALSYHCEGDAELLVMGSRQYGAIIAEHPDAQQAMKDFIL